MKFLQYKRELVENKGNEFFSGRKNIHSLYARDFGSFLSHDHEFPRSPWIKDMHDSSLWQRPVSVQALLGTGLERLWFSQMYFRSIIKKEKKMLREQMS